MGKNYYPQLFSEECKYVVKEKKMPKCIIDDIEISSDSDRENSVEENSYAENSDEGNFYEENSNEENTNQKKLSIEYELYKKQIIVKI